MAFPKMCDNDWHLKKYYLHDQEENEMKLFA